MKPNQIFFKKSKILPTDKFFRNVLYDKKFGYYTSQMPFGKNGDFITSPKISSIFSEIIAIWIVSSWETFGKPKNFNIVELGPGDGSLANILLKSFKKFPEFNSIKNMFLLEKSIFLRSVQKKKILNKDVKWIDNLNKIKKGPVVFFGNEFFDATSENSLAGNYPLARFLYVYVNRAPNAPLPVMEREFIKLILSKVGQGIVLKDGYIPLPARVVEGVLGDIGV